MCTTETKVTRHFSFTLQKKKVLTPLYIYRTVWFGNGSHIVKIR
jgi:hypothetical protein